MPIPASYEQVDPQSAEYRSVLGSIPQPEQFIYCQTWGVEINVIEPGPEPYAKSRYLHMPNCMLYRIPLDPPPPPIPA